MKLSAKGHFAPPPKLPSAAQRVSQTLATWDGLHARTHWFLGDESRVDGADFYLGEHEVGHIHLDGEAHVACSAGLVKSLVDAGLAQPFPWSRAFAVTRIRSQRDVEHALFIFQLSYDRHRGTPLSDLLARIEERAAKLTG